MDRIIEVLQILNKYGSYLYAEHDMLLFDNAEELNISNADMVRLEELGVFYSEEYDTLVFFI